MNPSDVRPGMMLGFHCSETDRVLQIINIISIDPVSLRAVVQCITRREQYWGPINAKTLRSPYWREIG